MSLLPFSNPPGQSYGTIVHPFPLPGIYLTRDDGRVVLLHVDATNHVVITLVNEPGSPIGLLLSLTYS